MAWSRFLWSWEKIYICFKLNENHQVTFPKIPKNHIYLDFGDGLMDGTENNKKTKMTKSFVWICVHIVLWTDSILFVVGVRSEIQAYYESISALEILLQ